MNTRRLWRIQRALTLLLALAAMVGACSDDPPGGQSAGQVTRIVVAPGSLNLTVGMTGQLTATGYDSNGSVVPAAMSWSSSAPGQATVSAAGDVTAVSQGTTTVSARAGNVSASSVVTVVPLSTSSGDVQVDPLVRHQTIRGWEATAEIGTTECNQTAYPLYKTAVLDRAISELGINRLRLSVRSGQESTTNWDSLLNAGAIARSEWLPRRYEIINDNADPNVLNLAGFHFTTLDQKVREIVLPLRQRLAARGETLYLNLNYVDFGSSAFEHRDAPAEYGEYMLAMFRHMQQTFGFVPDAIELVLEPDLAQWNGTQVGQAMVAAADRLSAAGFNPDFILPSTTNATNASTWFDAAMAVPRAAPLAKELGYHRYSGVSSTSLGAIRSRGQQFQVTPAMLEHIGSGIDELIEDLTVANAGSWQQFALAYCMPSDNGSAYYRIDQSSPTAPRVDISATSKLLSQLFRHVRMGAVRVGAASTQAQLRPVAFLNANGKLAVVVRATESRTFTVGGLPAGTWGVTYSTSLVLGATRPDVTLSGAQSLSADIPAPGVLVVWQK